MTPDHLVTINLSAPCSVCREWPESVHVSGLTVTCEAHCAACHPAADLSWIGTGAKAPVVGEQGGLF
jgi:hypothetical protein